MRFPIPDDLDWSPDDLTCFRVMWPDTVEWRAVLAGLLYLAARGRNWNEDTGSVLDVIQVGKMLAYENIPVRYCEGQQQPIDENETENYLLGLVGGDGADSEDEFMWSVTDVTIDEQGRLVLHYGPCCTKIVGSLPDAVSNTPGGGLVDPNTGEPIDNIWELLPPENRPDEFSACDAANAVVTKLRAVVASVIEHAGELDGTYQTLGEFPDLTIDPIRLALARGQWYTISVFEAIDPLTPDFGDVLWESDRVLDTRRWSYIRYALALRMPSDGSRPSKHDLCTWLNNAINANMPLFVANFVNLIKDAVGCGDLADVAQLGSVSTGLDCTPEAAPEIYDPLDDVPANATWAYYLDWTQGLYGFTLLQGTWEQGLGIYNNVSGSREAFYPKGNRARAAGTPDADNTMVYYCRLYFSEQPQLVGEVQYSDLFEFTASGVTTIYQDNQLPLRNVYEKLWPAGAAWNGVNISAFLTTFTARALLGQPNPTGRTVFQSLLIAGTGQPPYADLVNILE